MSVQEFFDNRLLLIGQHESSEYTLEGLRGWLAQELYKTRTHKIMACYEMAQEYLVGLIKAEASRLATKNLFKEAPCETSP